MLTIRRYELILVIIIFILTGSVIIVSKGTEEPNYLNHRYPHYVALTFDDGPYPVYTEKLLDILENENVSATFFVIGRHVKKYPELAKLIIIKKHEIGGHTYNHKNITKLEESDLFLELENTRKAIEESTGINTYLFRPPGGKFNTKTIKFVSRLGYSTVLWTVLPKDHKPHKTSKEITKYIVENTSPGDIILLHLGRKPTLDALPEIIWKLRLKGYKFVTISELLKEQKNHKNIYLANGLMNTDKR